MTGYGKKRTSPPSLKYPSSKKNTPALMVVSTITIKTVANLVSAVALAGNVPRTAVMVSVKIATGTSCSMADAPR